MKIFTLVVTLALMSAISVLGYQAAVANHDPGTPTAPTLSISAMGTNVTLTWTVPDQGSAPISSYVIEYMIHNNGYWNPVYLTNAGTTSYTLTDRAENIPYSFRVAAKNLYGTGHYSNTVNYVASETPSAPKNLTATAGEHRARLNWTAPENSGSSPITGYTIAYRVGNVNQFTVMANVSADTTSYTAWNLSTGVPFNFVVFARNAEGAGAYSNVATVTPQGGPHSVSSFAASPGDGQVNLAWTAPGNDGGSPITDYTILYKVRSGSFTTLANVSADTTSYTAQNLTNGTEYLFIVFATNAIGPGTHSDIVISTPGTVPSSPKNLTATPGSSQITLNWTAPDSNGGLPITGYAIMYGTSNGSFSLLATVPASATSYTATGLADYTTYYFVVNANNSMGAGEDSDVTFTAPTGPPSGCRPC